MASINWSNLRTDAQYIMDLAIELRGLVDGYSGGASVDTGDLGQLINELTAVAVGIGDKLGAEM